MKTAEELLSIANDVANDPAIVAANQAFTAALADLAALVENRRLTLHATVTQLALLGELGPGCTAASWGGELYDVARSTTHRFYSPVDAIAAVLRAVLHADDVATLRTHL